MKELSYDSAALWQQALNDAKIVQERLIMARQLAATDRVGALGFAKEALLAVESLRSRATQSSALLGIILYFAIDLEVRLHYMEEVPASNLDKTIATEIDRSKQLLTAIKGHIDEQ